jgi:hypothetical protein
MKASSNELIVSTSTARPTRFLWALVLAALAVAVLAGSALAAANLVRNGSFEKDGNGDGEPNSWDRDASLGILPRRDCNKSYAGACSLKFSLDNQFKYVISSNVVAGGPSGVAYTLYFWAKTKDLVTGISPMQVQLYFHYTDDTNSHFSVNIPQGTQSWQALNVTPISGKTFDYLYVVIESDQDSGKVWFDKMKVESGCGPNC